MPINKLRILRKINQLNVPILRKTAIKEKVLKESI